MLNPAQTDTGLSDYWLVDMVSVSLAVTVDANGLFETAIPIAKTGYTPIGMVGYGLTRDSTMNLIITGVRVSSNNLIISGVDKRTSHGIAGGVFVLWQKS